MESAVPGQVVNAGGCFEENDRRAFGLRFLTSHLMRYKCYLEIIEPADKSAFDALGEKIFEHGLPIIPLLIPQPDQQITRDFLE